MADNTIKIRIKNKIDTAENWGAKTTFIPLNGEVIVYSDLNKIKIGNGVTLLANLPFMQAEDNTKVNISQGSAKAGQFLVVGSDGNVTTRAIPNAEDNTFGGN